MNIYYYCLDVNSFISHVGMRYMSDKTKIRSILSQFVKEYQGGIIKNYDVITAEKIKDDNFIPLRDEDEYENWYSDQEDRWDFTNRYNDVFEQVSDNIAISSNRTTKPDEFVIRNDVSNNNDLPPRDTTAFDEEQLMNYNKKLVENPDDVITERNKVELLEELGRYEEIMRFYDEMIEKDPDKSYYMACKGELLERLGQYEEATKCYNETYEDDPDNKDYLMYKVNLFEKLGRYEDAIRCYDRIIDLDTDNGMLLRKAYLLHYIGKHKESLECFYRDPDVIEIRAIDQCYVDQMSWLKGLFLTKIGMYEDAIKCYDKAMREDPWDTQLIAILTTKGDILAHLERYEEAIACYDKILEINQNHNPMYYGLHIIYDKTTVLSKKTSALYYLGKYDEAIKCYDMINKRSIFKYRNFPTSVDT